MFKVEIKVPADWTNVRAKNIRVKIPASHKDGKTYLNDTEIHELFDYILMGD